MDKLTVASHDAKISLWTERIKHCKASGLTVNRWCQQNGLNIKTYYYWMRKIKREAFGTLQEQAALPATKNVFTEVSLTGSYTEPENTAAILYINGIRIEIQNGAGAGTIQALLSSVRSLCQAIFHGQSTYTLPVDIRICGNQ